MSNKIKRKGDNILRDALAILAITLVAGGLLGLVYNITKNPIDEAAETSKNASYEVVVSGAAAFVKEDKLVDAMKSYPVKEMEFNEIVTGQDKDGKTVGYALMVTSKKGYGGDIQFTVGVNPAGKITGVEIISASETAGLGANCTKDEFKNQYIGKSGQVELKKGDADSTKEEVNAISGATITSTAITDAVNQVLDFLKTEGVDAGE